MAIIENIILTTSLLLDLQLPFWYNQLIPKRVLIKYQIIKQILLIKIILHHDSFWR